MLRMPKHLNNLLRKCISICKYGEEKERMYPLFDFTDLSLTSFLFLFFSLSYSLQLLIRSPELFDPNTLKDLSEADYTVKFWGRLIELTFTKTELIPQW
jgi:hypothetical protein